jgi:hypothetical protein
VLVKPYRVTFKCGRRVLLSFECMAASSIDAAIQHLCLAEPGSYMSVRPA